MSQYAGDTAGRKAIVVAEATAVVDFVIVGVDFQFVQKTTDSLSAGLPGTLPSSGCRLRLVRCVSAESLQ